MLENEDCEAAGAAILYVGLMAPERCDDRFMKVFEQALATEDEDVRLHTFDALAYPKWPETKKLAEKAATQDASERVRWKANRFLEAWRHFGWPG